MGGVLNRIAQALREAPALQRLEERGCPTKEERLDDATVQQVFFELSFVLVGETLDIMRDCRDNVIEGKDEGKEERKIELLLDTIERTYVLPIAWRRGVGLQLFRSKLFSVDYSCSE